MGNIQKLVRCMRFKIHDVITPARAALLRHQQKACRAKPRQHFHAMHWDWVTDLCVQIWKHMGRKLLKTVQTITTFRNPLADPVGTRRGPPLVRGPQFENRCSKLFVHELRFVTFPLDYRWKYVRGHCACADSRDPWVGGQKRLHCWNLCPRFAYSLHNVYWAMATIKGRLLSSVSNAKTLDCVNFLCVTVCPWPLTV